MNFHWLLPRQKGIPVLMYHRIWPGIKDRITQTPEQLREQWLYLKQEGYDAISLQEYMELATGTKQQDKKCVLITFDDGYLNNLTYAYPLLQEFGFKATFFIIGDTLEGQLDDQEELTTRMNVAQLRSLDPETIQLAMHGFHHENFKTTSITDLKAAIIRSVEAFALQRIPLHKALAYPYGGRPKDRNTFNELKQWMKQESIAAAFRIGNRVSEIPARDLYEINRIDIRGTDSFSDFKIKLKKGKLNPF